MTISFDAKTCHQLEQAIHLEWLCTNGLGGYASGTVAGPNSRKYHGYMVVAAKPPVDRFVMLARVEDRIVVNGPLPVVYDLATTEFADIVHPLGHLHLLGFELRDGAPVWRYQIGAAVVEKSLTMVHGQDTVILKYEVVNTVDGAVQPMKLHVQPMLAGRDFHSTIQLQGRPGWRVSHEASGTLMLATRPEECPLPLAITHNAERFHVNACWWYNFKFRVETARGYPDREDLWTPGGLEFSLAPGKPAILIASTKPVPVATHAVLLAQQTSRHQQLSGTFTRTHPQDELLAQLSVAADQFIVQRGTGDKKTVIAGYPWFEDWGRDTFIALAGLTLVTGRQEVAKSILSVFADHLQRGLLPNRFPDKSVKPDYNTVDASQWFIHAAYQYWRYSGDVAFLTKYLFPKLCEIIDAYSRGTDYGIRADVDGLIRQGEPGHNLTWMDAKIGDWVVTPRQGKPVEINALWYSNLRIMTIIARAAGDSARAAKFETMAAQVQSVFQKTFWNESTHCLHDVISDAGVGDGLVRPNQCVAVAVPFSPLDAAAQRAVMDTVEELLWTPLGPRTLAPGSPGYHAHCAGDQRARDMAYHQGTVWPWLVGPFITGWVKTHGATTVARAEAWKFITPFAAHLREAGLGSISEIADSAAPHTPRGTPAQAWSVAEVLRAYTEDVLAMAPPWPHELAR